MAGFLTYFSIFALTVIWILGWAGASYVAGAFFDLPMKTTILAGALLGPLGFVVVIATGVLERGSRRNGGASFPDRATVAAGDGPDDWNLF
jgi:hypothetical protein